MAERQYYNTAVVAFERVGVDLNLVEPSEIPVPPDEVRIRDLAIEAMPDGQRLKVGISLTPFQKPPAIDVTILGHDGQEVASTTIIEPVAHRMSFTMHLRGAGPGRDYRVVCTVRYIDGPEVDQKELPLQLE